MSTKPVGDSRDKWASGGQTLSLYRSRKDLHADHHDQGHVQRAFLFTFTPNPIWTEAAMSYTRYHIHTQPAPNLGGHPNRFNVKVDRLGLAKLLVGEIIHTRADMRVVTSRPCMYGVFSGPIGGFAPRPQHCVGCLRCTVQYPDMVKVLPNPKRLELGDSYFGPDLVDTVIYEASTGRVPVRGAGYGGSFGGKNWDGMWTDMSEIVRPTRDGIHGREFISTSVDIGSKPLLLHFDHHGKLLSAGARTHTLPIPYLLELPVPTQPIAQALQSAAAATGTVLTIPIDKALEFGLEGQALAPILDPEQSTKLSRFNTTPDLLELTRWDVEHVTSLREDHPGIVIGLRNTFDQIDVIEAVNLGVDFLHLTADYHGRTPDDFVLDAIRSAHERLVEAGLRERISLIGSGGIAAAEHVPKAIICGLDAVALDTPLLIALQAQFKGEYTQADVNNVKLLPFDVDWGQQRIVNLLGSWRDQLLEILGAMGLREVRRLRGEMGRAMFQIELEQEAFAGIPGFEEVDNG
jgi:hypothetical protein